MDLGLVSLGREAPRLFFLHYCEEEFEFALVQRQQIVRARSVEAVGLRPGIGLTQDQPVGRGAEELVGGGVAPFPVTDGDDAEIAVDEDIVRAEIIADEVEGPGGVGWGCEAWQQLAEKVT